MKTFWYINLALLLAISLSVGCATTQDIASTVTSKVTSTVSSFTSGVDENLYAQVPADKREGVQEAELALKVSEEKTTLAQLKKELALNQKKYADFEADLARGHSNDAAIALDIAKLEAIDGAGLGKKEDSIKAIAELRAKKLRMEADSINIKAKLSTTELQINDLTKQIEEQEEKIKEMTGQVEEEITSPTAGEQEQEQKQ